MWKRAVASGGRCPSSQKHVRARQRRVTAQIDLGRGREPAEIELDVSADEKGRLGQVHLARHQLHPRRVTSRGQDADGRRIAGEGSVGERVHLSERLGDGHGALVNGGWSGLK